MLQPSTGVLFAGLGALLLLAAFFAGSETALMSLNRYRLRHRAKAGQRGARLAEALLAHPDRLIGLILLLSTIVNVVTPTMVGLITFRLGGDYLVAIGVIALTFVMLIFCEVAPKTFGALHPERLAIPARRAPLQRRARPSAPGPAFRQSAAPCPSTDPRDSPPRSR
jgi:Mg2+/Co2+ transporter CorB